MSSPRMLARVQPPCGAVAKVRQGNAALHRIGVGVGTPQQRRVPGDHPGRFLCPGPPHVSATAVGSSGIAAAIATANRVARAAARPPTRPPSGRSPRDRVGGARCAPCLTGNAAGRRGGRERRGAGRSGRAERAGEGGPGRGGRGASPAAAGCRWGDRDGGPPPPPGRPGTGWALPARPGRPNRRARRSAPPDPLRRSGGIVLVPARYADDQRRWPVRVAGGADRSPSAGRSVRGAGPKVPGLIRAPTVGDHLLTRSGPPVHPLPHPQAITRSRTPAHPHPA